MKNQLEKQVGTNFKAKLACESKKMYWGTHFLLPKSLKMASWRLQEGPKEVVLTPTHEQASEPTPRGGGRGRGNPSPGTGD